MAQKIFSRKERKINRMLYTIICFPSCERDIPKYFANALCKLDTLIKVAAHGILERSENIGKVVLRVREGE